MKKSELSVTEIAREQLSDWRSILQKNIYENDRDFIHSIQYYFPEDFSRLNRELLNFGEKVAHPLMDLVTENNLPRNWPRLENYDGLGNYQAKIIHHPHYAEAGDIIYGSGLLQKMAHPGGLLEALSFFFLSSHAGEAGHNCPIACSAGMIRVLQKVKNFPQKDFYLQKLLKPSYQENFTAAQFLTEIQGGSDVGANAVFAEPAKNNTWKIYGEKWFCSNANADLFFLTARVDEKISGTKGLGLFLVPAKLENGAPNFFELKRLKEKIGTCSMATAEIEFQGSLAHVMNDPQDGFKLVMENVLHLSRLFNAFCVTGMARRAYFVARSYAQYRHAFSQPIENYPLVKENLAGIKAENTALVSAIFATARLQDDVDSEKNRDEEIKLLLRLLVNLNKYLSALWSFEHIHHAIDVLAGNGMIETFSPLPRFLRDSLVCENWEGTHNILRMQIARDMHKFALDEIFIRHISLELSKNRDEKFLLVLQNECQDLKKLLSQWRDMNESLQALRIREVIDRMAILYSAVMLRNEAEHQRDTQKNSAKFYCLELFCRLHFTQKSIEKDQHYLDLLTRIIAVK